MKVERRWRTRFDRIDSPKPSFERDTTAVKKTYHIIDREEKTAAAAIEEFAKANGQLLLPLVEYHPRPDRR